MDLPRTAVHKMSAGLSRAEVDRAIYLDFEGFPDTRPALMGCLTGRTFTQQVFAKGLWRLAVREACPTRAEVDKWIVKRGEFGRAVGRLVERCRRDGRVLVAFTEHEKQVMAQFAPSVDVTPYYR